MEENFHIVPWYNTDEWIYVYNKLYEQPSSLENKQEALDYLLIWKDRCPESLSSGLESTLTLLQVHLEDEKNNCRNEVLLQLAYSSAIMSFVNQTLDSEIAKGCSLYQAAHRLAVPDWVIHMRHDIAHSNSRPSLQSLRKATRVGFDWLRKNYWDVFKEFIADYTPKKTQVSEEVDIKIVAVMDFCATLSIWSHSNSEITNLADIPDEDVRKSIVYDANELLGYTIDPSSFRSVSVMSLVRLMNNKAKKLLKSKNLVSSVNKALLGSDSVFLSFDLLKTMDTRKFNSTEKLNSNYVQCFEVLLTFLHSNDLLLEFILELIRITQQYYNNTEKCLMQKLAALWVSEILKALKRSIMFCDRTKMLKCSELSAKSKSDWKSLFHHWFPNEKTSSLFLDLFKSVPSELRKINFIRPIINTYNPYLNYFIKDLFNLLEPKLQQYTVDNLCKLASMISAPEKLEAASTISKLYTVDDLKSSDNEVDDSDCVEVLDDQDRELRDEVNQSFLRNSVFKLASGHL